jgi:hypothetical protein
MKYYRQTLPARTNLKICFGLLLGTLITIKGRLFTDVYGSNTALSSNGRNVRILR